MEENTMRYNSSRDRITRSLGVLVGVALVAALVLPSAVQAQTGGRRPQKPTVAYVISGDDMRVSTTNNVDISTHNYFVFNITDPDTGIRTQLASNTVPVEKWILVKAGGRTGHGVWEFSIYSVQAGRLHRHPRSPVTSTTPGAIKAYYLPGTQEVDEPDYVAPGSAAPPDATSPTSDTTTYTHGPPEAPELFEYSTPAATVNLFSWTDANKKDSGITGYRLQWTTGEPDLVSTKWESAPDIEETAGTYRLTPDDLKKVEEDTAYTFRLRALGSSSYVSTNYGDDRKVAGDPALIMLMLGTPSSTTTPPPTSTPTLPEWAAMFLAMLLLGSGAYLLRGRQQGGLIL